MYNKLFFLQRLSTDIHIYIYIYEFEIMRDTVNMYINM